MRHYSRDAWEAAKLAKQAATSASVTALDDTAPSQKGAKRPVQASAFTSAPSPAEQVRRRYIDVSRLTVSQASGPARIRVARTLRRATSTSGPTTWDRLLSFCLRLRRFV
jgi:hypothetical protein